MTNTSAPDPSAENPAPVDSETPEAIDGAAIGELAAKAVDELSQAVQRNPLAAVGVAFTAGLFIALLSKG